MSSRSTPNEDALRAALTAQGVTDPEAQAAVLRALRATPDPWALARWFSPCARPARHGRHA